jgi:hypothetical protein
MVFLLKTATLEAKNMPARCRDQESMSNFSTTLSACTSRHRQAFSAPPRRISDNQWHFEHKFKVDDAHYVEKTDQYYFYLDFDIRGFFGLGIHHKLFLIFLTFRLAISSV